MKKPEKLSERTVAKLNKAMEKDTGEMLIVLEEQRKPLDRVLSSNREFRKEIYKQIGSADLVNDELVTFGQTYAQENGYRIDEIGNPGAVQPDRCDAERRSRSDSCGSKRHYGRGDGTFAEGICQETCKASSWKEYR